MAAATFIDEVDLQKLHTERLTNGLSLLLMAIMSTTKPPSRGTWDPRSISKCFTHSQEAARQVVTLPPMLRLERLPVVAHVTPRFCIHTHTKLTGRILLRAEVTTAGRIM